MANELKPRLCVMNKRENGYGFHLHGEKGKSGQYIRRVEPGSPAEASGLRAGDRVVEVNGKNVEKETHHQVVQRIKAVEHETRLLVVDRETDEYLRSMRLSCTDDSTATGGSEVPSSPSHVPSRKENGSVSRQVVRLANEKPRLTKSSPSRSTKKESKSKAQVQAQNEEQNQTETTELFPRLCHLLRGETGYGFNLHSEKSRPGQYIRSLDPGSAADRAGLKPQDRLIEVNGVNIEALRHSEVVAFIKSGGSETHLLVVDQATDEHFKKLGITPTRSHIKDYSGQAITNGSESLQVNGSSASQSSRSDTSSSDRQVLDEDESPLLDPFEESGLYLSPTAAEAKEKLHAKRAKKRAPQMDWNKKHEIFSNF
ncbi:Na(+)/H(+) exchange regulatory cofactor NHE-RF2 [Paramormyrops kingsleyae]|uniref:Na(+)/H(+) exchange regulatory cofactor NHE-RF n=1 Tax=Paramormyrops kingsleyae TaxID=1676925 RepID=A0A3B3RLQ0_9TELE|nr:Na(+)/H(+) exchange regulatory cofactor NHE-RF2-like isoform X2 [Paramormyrops kingsleyae]